MTNLWPVYEFRPLPEWVRGSEVYRFAGGEWIKDDGQYDLAFANIGDGPPMAYGIYLPYRANIIWQWVTHHWRDEEPRHPGGNAWHYMLREGATNCRESWPRDGHENTRAQTAAMNWVADKCRCANGHGVEFNLADSVIRLGLLRERDSKAIVLRPEQPICMYCGPQSA